MRIEHFALQVPDPRAMADWYVTNLGCSVARSGSGPSHMRFLQAGGVLVELYCNPKASVPDYSALDPLHFHFAFESQNIAADRERLLRAGARVVEDVATTPAGDQILMLRDPWNVPLQFVHRAQPMLAG